MIRAAQRTCLLTAGHGVPVTGNRGKPEEINAYDYWGVWRKLNALADYTFTGNQRAKYVAFEETRTGKWRLGGLRPVIPMQQSDVPILNSASNPDFTWSARCLYALGSPCF